MLSRTLLIYIFLSGTTGAFAQKVISAGVFTGITVPFTLDKGIDSDARYQKKYDVKLAPIGFHYGIDFEEAGFGVFTSPGLIRIGQNFFVVNTVGGQTGERKVNYSYLQIPLSFKVHIIDLAFFRLNFVASAGAGFLLDGDETIRHARSKLFFPDLALNHLPPDYDEEYDGVIVPDISELQIQSKENFSGLQFFGAVGFRADWDVSEHWRVCFDLQGNYGILETRKSDYLDDLKTTGALYDTYGSRREVFVHFNVGLSRTLQIDKKGTNFKKTNHKNKRHRPRG